MKKQTATKTRLITNTRLIIGTAVLAGVSLSAFMMAALLTQTTCTGTRGDLSKDSLLGPDDIAVMKEIIAGTKPFDVCGDMNGDGVIGPGDIADLQNLISGQTTTPAIPATSPMTAPLKSYTSFQTFNKNYTSDTQIRLSTKSPIYSFVIDADVNLPNAWSLVRLTLTDTKGGEFLVYEGYPLISGLGKITVNKICDETCILNYITPQYLNIQIEDGSIYLKNAYAALQLNDLNDNARQLGIDVYAKEMKLVTDRLKINKINAAVQIKDIDMRWTAGETLVSNLFYAEKKQLFSDSQNLPNLQGFEYYKGGTFEVASPVMPEDIAEEKDARSEADIIRNQSKAPNAKLISSDNLTEDMLDTLSPNTYIIRPSEWDWRKQNGENLITPAQNQLGCGACVEFAVNGMVEAKINLWYNQHIDANISEQSIMCQLFPDSSILHDDACDGTKTYRALNKYIFSGGITSETCFPYQGKHYNCKEKICDSGKWGIAGYKAIGNDRKDLKNALLTAGPIAFGIRKMQHEVVLVGYKDVYWPNGYLRAVKWIIKSSWGTSWGVDGYADLYVSKSNRDQDYYVRKPYFKDNPNKYKINCVDNDKDNYCYWGISSPYKPASCPVNCLNTWDRNDCNPSVGPKAGTQDCERVFTCQPKPEPNTEWNTVASYTQKLDGSNWTPPDDPITEYKTDFTATPSYSSCQFKCVDGYYWDGTSCKPTNCNGSIPANATICPGDLDDVTVESHTYIKLVPTCTAKNKCEVVCNNGYIIKNGMCWYNY